MEEEKKKFKLHFPNGAAFFMIMILITAVLTIVIPSGAFERMLDEATGRTLVVDGTFQFLDKEYITFS